MIQFIDFCWHDVIQSAFQIARSGPHSVSGNDRRWMCRFSHRADKAQQACMTGHHYPALLMCRNRCTTTIGTFCVLMTLDLSQLRINIDINTCLGTHRLWESGRPRWPQSIPEAAGLVAPELLEWFLGRSRPPQSMVPDTGVHDYTNTKLGQWLRIGGVYYIARALGNHVWLSARAASHLTYQIGRLTKSKRAICSYHSHGQRAGIGAVRIDVLLLRSRRGPLDYGGIQRRLAHKRHPPHCRGTSCEAPR